MDFFKFIVVVYAISALADYTNKEDCTQNNIPNITIEKTISKKEKVVEEKIIKNKPEVKEEKIDSSWQNLKLLDN